MSRRQREPLRALSAEERGGLLRPSRSRRAPAAQAARATALPAVADGRSYVAAARRAGRRDGDAVVNLFGSHSPPLAANMGNERQTTPPPAAGIVY